ncbi:MAG: phage tail protein [Flavobacteriaceae bacterium]|nr:phage tail protein [Flavobacteriaceae bacterium]
MDQATLPSSEFYFELSANGEQTTFQEVTGISTEVALPKLLKKDENPSKFRLPSLPKTGNLILKNGRSVQDSKLLQWCASCQNATSNTSVEKTRVALHLKDAKGKLLLEWTLFNAYPVKNNMASSNPNTKETEIKDLELAYSFFTLSKK